MSWGCSWTECLFDFCVRIYLKHFKNKSCDQSRGDEYESTNAFSMSGSQYSAYNFGWRACDPCLSLGNAMLWPSIAVEKKILVTTTKLVKKYQHHANRHVEDNEEKDGTGKVENADICLAYPDEYQSQLCC